MSDCPNCFGRAFVIETRHDHAGGTRRRFQCAECRYRWTVWNGEAPPPAAPAAAIDEAAVRDILTSTGTHAEVADRYRVSASTIGQVRRGELHASIAPELQRWDRKGARGLRQVCTNCQYWSDARCDLGFPDPLEEGPSFARDCSTYAPRAV